MVKLNCDLIFQKNRTKYFYSMIGWFLVINILLSIAMFEMRMNGWMIDWIIEQMYASMNEWLNERWNKWSNECMYSMNEKVIE